MKKLMTRAGWILLGLLICYCGFKNMILNVWSYPSEPTAYQITGVDGRQMTIVFLPSKETLFHYKHSANEEEYVLTKMKGVYGTHYLGPIWTVEGPTISFGLRWVSRNAKPVLMEIEWKNKQILGDMRSTFPDKGSKSHSVYLFTNDAMNFQGMWLDKTVLDSRILSEMLTYLKNHR